MESSRVFVKGLPPNLGADDFKRHFSKQSAITDAKFIPHRRIGYVGYRTPEDATNAVKYYNKSYIRMSKIGVELARSVEDQYALGPGINSANSSKKEHEDIQEQGPPHANSDGKKKRKREGPADNGAKPKLQEFLEIMQPPSKSKIWENQDAAISQVSAQSTPKAEDPVTRGARSDEVYEQAPKRRKKERESEEKSVLPAERPVPVDRPQMDARTVSSDRDLSQEATQEPLAESSAASDADWLRSRTSRLLGLVDDDDVQITALSGDAPTEKKGVSEVPELVREGSVSDASVQTDKEVEVAGAILEKEAAGSGRLFVRNLTYTTTEEDLRKHFEDGGHGIIEEVHLCFNSRSGKNKGFAHVQYTEPEAATKALRILDGKPFQGRLLHLMPANAKKETTLDEFAISKLPLKKQQNIKRKADAALSTFNWNSMYMSSDAVMSSISDRLGVAKSELLDPTSSGAAVKQAHAETHIIQETKSYFTNHGVDLEAFRGKERGNTAILVKNFSYGTKSEELKKLFEAHGQIKKLLMPPSGTIAIVEYDQDDHAKSAFGSLAYRKFKDSILFLEKAPKNLFHDVQSLPDSRTDEPAKSRSAKPSATELLESRDAPELANPSTLFVRNLNFSTTTDRLREVFQPLEGYMSAKVKTKTDPKKPGQLLSMGFGFLEFRSKNNAQAALAAMDGYKLDGHELLIRASHKAIDAAEERRKEGEAKKIAGKKTKIIIKNLPFEASKKDVRSLFGSYGQLRSVRVPKKFDSSTRGFAFADFVTAREAENAMDALRDTHLLGRRLVLDFAAEDAVDPEQEIEKMQQRVGKQADKVALQRLTGSGRKKFHIEGADEQD